MKLINKVKHAPKWLKIGSLILIVLIAFSIVRQTQLSSANKPQYQTVTAEKGTLITSVSASGNITNGNNLTIVTNATGTVGKVYVKNGDTVKQGQKIAEITLDRDAEQKQAAAYASYLNAQNTVTTAVQNKGSSDASMWQAQQSLLNAQNAVNVMNDNITNGNSNPSTKKEYTDLEKASINSALVQAQKTFDIAQQKYNQTDSSISVAKAQQTSAWYTYQQYSPIITAPRSGVITNLMIAPGSVISVQTNSSNSNGSTPQQLGNITQPNDNVQASVDLAEIDAARVQPGQKVTLTLDAFPDKTFTGKVLIVNTNGQSTSGVTTYPATIVFDTSASNIYPKMAVTAKIITTIKNDVILVPSSSVQASNGQSSVRTLQKGQLMLVPVEVGDSNDTQTEIISGINEGDTVITSVSNTSSSKTPTTTSPFGGFGSGGNRQMIRINR